MQPEAMWNAFAAAVVDLGGTPERPSPPEALTALETTLAEPVVGFDPLRNDDVLLFQVSTEAGTTTAALERRLWMGEDGEDTYEVQARWNFTGSPEMGRRSVQIFGSGPGCREQPDSLTFDRFPAAVTSHASWLELCAARSVEIICWHNP